MRLDISLQRLFPVPIERLWHAVTDPQEIEHWLMRTDGFAAAVGTRFTLRDDPRPDCRGHVECEVLEISPPDRMIWSWRAADDPATTRLVIELHAEDQGTRLTLRHTGEADQRTITATTRGWTDKLAALGDLLTTQGDNPND